IVLPSQPNRLAIAPVVSRSSTYRRRRKAMSMNVPGMFAPQAWRRTDAEVNVHVFIHLAAPERRAHAARSARVTRKRFPVLRRAAPVSSIDAGTESYPGRCAAARVAA